MAWFDEFNLPGATIDGYFGFIQADGPDDDDHPDVVLANGTVTFTATTEAARIDGAWLGIQPVTAQIFEGKIVISEEDPRPVRLLATDAPIGVADWAWKASFKVDGFRLNELTFRAPRDTTVNLTADLIPIKSQPYQIIEGASIVDTEVDTAGERMRFKMSDGTFTDWVNVPNGEPGAKGDPGPKGDPGADGQAATLAMGTVTAGATADAWMTGTASARQLNLTLPRGPKGDPAAAPVALTETSNLNTLAPGVYMVSNVVIARALGLPWEYPCVIVVEPASTGNAVSYRANTLEQPPRQFLRSRLNNGTMSVWAEVAMVSGMESGDTSGVVRRDLLRQGLTARKGGTIGTAGRGAVALRFDDAPTAFVEKVLPLLRERGLPFTRVSTSDSIASTGETITDADLTAMQDYCIADGGEVWNHGRDHADATGEAAIFDNLIGSLVKLREKMPRIPVDCFAPPGGAVSYGGFMPAYSITNWSDTYAGRLLMAHHAVASGYLRDSYYRPIDGQVRDGQIHYSVDAYTLANAKTLVDRARDWRVGVVMMWHGHNLDTEGNMSTADLALFLDYLVEQRDAGSVLVLTKTGLSVADARSDQRGNVLSTSAGSPFSESLTYPQYRQGILGSTRELLATVTGTAGQTVTSVVGESTRTHTIPASGTLALRHVATIPLDVTTLTVSIDAATTGARLLAV